MEQPRKIPKSTEKPSAPPPPRTFFTLYGRYLGGIMVAGAWKIPYFVPHRIEGKYMKIQAKKILHSLNSELAHAAAHFFHCCCRAQPWMAWTRRRRRCRRSRRPVPRKSAEQHRCYRMTGPASHVVKITMPLDLNATRALGRRVRPLPPLISGSGSACAVKDLIILIGPRVSNVARRGVRPL